jgi:hypothetical protein
MKIGNPAMYNSLGKLLTLMEVMDEPAKAITNALMAKGTDFEDWVTIECALFHHVDMIVSRNIRHFKNSPLKVYTPAEFLSRLKWLLEGRDKR